MTEILWALVALLALAGWATTLVFIGKTLLPQANAIAQIHRVNNVIDDRVSAVVERIRKIQERPSGAPKPPLPDKETALRDQVDRLFGGEAMSPIDEQPLPEGLEVLDV